VGIATPSFHRMCRFLSEVLSLPEPTQTEQEAVFPLAGGDEAEVFGPGNRYFELYRREARGPVPQFRAEDLDGALEELRQADVELVGEPEQAGDDRWAHFRAPDGNLYEMAWAPPDRSSQGGLVWLGTRTANHRDMAAFCSGVLGMAAGSDEPGMTQFVMQNGDQVEIFTEDEPNHAHFGAGPVVGFRVVNWQRARERLGAAGAELLGPAYREGPWSWQHFRAPDDNVYEITRGPFTPPSSG
jgi:glyoxylase I family protein